MKYKLSQEHWYKLWGEKGFVGISARVLQWNVQYKPMFNLNYIEDHKNNWGAIIGEEKYITMFLLQL